MQSQAYKNQVSLLLDVLPEVSREDCFALHGGTAINLFVRNMPRLSVDIDLTYVVVEDRDKSIENINRALARISARVTAANPAIVIRHREEVCKLQVSRQATDIKIEVNLVGRGTISDPVRMPLCDRAQREFDVFCEAPVVPLGQLYGGKICAALDRQHPRDLFDVSYMLRTEGFSDGIRKGFLYCLLGSDRPMNEVLRPNFRGQRQAMNNQFNGMTAEAFDYVAYERVRESLISVVKSSLTPDDRRFLMSIKELKPDWSVYDFSAFPSVRWKLLNLEKLKSANPGKHRELAAALHAKLWPSG